VKVAGIVLSHVNTRRHAAFAAGEGYYRSYAISRKDGRQFSDSVVPRDTIPIEAKVDALALLNGSVAGSPSPRPSVF
jgi:hypothetical protein